MIVWQLARVIKVLEERDDYQMVQVLLLSAASEGGRGASEAPGSAVNYPAVIGRVSEGDTVLLNTTAVSLSLGTGGVHFVAAIWPLREERPLSHASAGHIMKMRYTPYQSAVLSVEEESSPYHAMLKQRDSLENTPVLVGELHSMLPILVTVLRHCLPSSTRIIYVMSDGGALPLAFSNHVNGLQSLGWLDGTVTYGHAFGGQLEAVNVYSALLAAKHALHADIIVMMMGPGIVGTGTPWGFSGLEVAEMLHATWTLDGLPFFVPRMHSGESRRRHQGISHHTRLLLNRCVLTPVLVPLPPSAFMEGLDELYQSLHPRHLYLQEQVLSWKEMSQLFSLYPDEILSMGRDREGDPLYFYAVGHSAAMVSQWLNAGSHEIDPPSQMAAIAQYVHAQSTARGREDHSTAK